MLVDIDVKARERFVIVVLIRVVALFFSAFVDSSTTALEISQSVPAQNLQVGFSQVPGEGEIQLPTLGTGEHNREVDTENQPPAKDTWGQKLLTEFAGVLIAAGDGLNSDHGPTMLSAVTHQTRRRVRRRVARRVAASTQGWLRQYGQASVSFDGDMEKNFSWHVDYSQPVYQSRKDTFLFEVGGRSEYGQHLVGSGLVYRRGWRRGQIVGMNLFLDHCLATSDRSTAAQHRGGVGVEWKTPRWVVGANAYMPVSNWKTIDRSTSSDSSTHSDTLWRHSRPAGGIDVTFQGQLAYAPLSIKAGYSRWFGDAVGVVKQGSVSSALGHGNTLGVVWQPIPLFKLSINHTFAPEGQQNDWFRAELHINLAKSIRRHLRRIDTESARSRWRAVRYQFVNRTREMVLAFRGHILEAGPDVTRELCPNPNSECSFIQAATGDNGGKVTYSSSNPDVAKVETTTGRVTLVGAGTTRITATEAATGTYQAQSDSYMLTVVAKVSPRLHLDCDDTGSCPDPYEAIHDDNFITTVGVSGEGQGTVRCDVEHSDVATCLESDGVWQIRPLQVADTKIIFTKTWEDSESEMSRASFNYQINKGGNPLTLQCDNDNCGDTYQVTYADDLTTQVKVSGGNQGTVTCGVNDQQIATCSTFDNHWLLKPQKAGETKITFTETKKNFKTAEASFSYKVAQGQCTPPLSIIPTETPSTKVGGTYTHTPKGGNGSKISWSSSPEAKATIDQDGKVTGIAKGTCTITGKQAETDKWLAEEDSYTLLVGEEHFFTIKWQHAGAGFPAPLD